MLHGDNRNGSGLFPFSGWGYSVFFPFFAASSLFHVLSGQQALGLINVSCFLVSDLKRAPLACASATRNLMQTDNKLDQTGGEVA